MELSSRRSRPPALVIAILALAWLAPAALPAGNPASQPSTRAADEAGTGAASVASDDATVHHRFEDVEQWVKVFDDPARDAWQKPDELVRALGVAAGGRVADLGAGTGYFERYLARAVGSTGAVYAVDVEPALVQHLRARAEKEKSPNVIPVLASFDNPRLPPASIDLVLIVDTYHHIDARLLYFADLRRILSPRGRVAIVDFQKREIPVGPPVEHKLAKDQIVGEMAKAGYALDRDMEGLLPYQYVLVFKTSDGR